MEQTGNDRALRRLEWFIKEWRQRKGLTQEQLATRLDTNKGQVSKLERGDQRMNDYWILGISEALGISPGDLLTPPDRPTLDDLLREASQEQVSKIRDIVRAFLGKSAT